jgi:hypothetical protein
LIENDEKSDYVEIDPELVKIYEQSNKKLKAYETNLKKLNFVKNYETSVL